MTEINTFSSAVDDIIIRTGRPDLKQDIIAYVRLTIRECQVKRFFRNDMIEDTLTSDGDVYIWNYPQEFRIIRTVRYPYVNLRGERIYPKEINPGKLQRSETHFYYGGPGYYSFAGLALNDEFDIAYYQNSRKLPYYELADRPATFNLELNAWAYKTAATEATKLVAREAVSNWLLFNYYDTIVTGASNKVFILKNDERSKATFALYKSLQNDLIANEPSDSLNR